MRILFECYTCNPSGGSEEYNGWHWPLSIAKLGHEVHVITRPTAHDSIVAQLAREPVPNLHFHEVNSAEWVTRLPRGYGLHYLVWLRKSLRHARLLGRFDVIHHATWGSLLAGALLWRLGSPTVLGPCGGGQTMPPALFQLLVADRKA